MGQIKDIEDDDGDVVQRVLPCRRLPKRRTNHELNVDRNLR